MMPENTPRPTASDETAKSDAGAPWLPRFGIAEMMLAMLILCVMAAAGSYLKKAVDNNQGVPVFVMFTLASPIAVVLVLSAYLGLKRWLRDR